MSEQGVVLLGSGGFRSVRPVGQRTAQYAAVLRSLVANFLSWVRDPLKRFWSPGRLPLLSYCQIRPELPARRAALPRRGVVAGHPQRVLRGEGTAAAGAGVPPVGGRVDHRTAAGEPLTSSLNDLIQLTIFALLRP